MHFEDTIKSVRQVRTMKYFNEADFCFRISILPKLKRCQTKNSNPKHYFNRMKSPIIFSTILSILMQPRRELLNCPLAILTAISELYF